MTLRTLTTLATFANNETHPYGVLTLDASGSLFGTTGVSPSTNSSGSVVQGTIYQLVQGGSTIIPFITFLNGTNGADPVGGLTFAADGILDGATAFGGSAGDGTLFELRGGAVTTLATFTGANGAVPQSVLTVDAAGDLFGVTNQGGSANLGTVFELVKGATTVTTLATFTGANGAYAEGGVVFDAAGDLFGTTVSGGSANLGTIFELAKGATTVKTLVDFTGPNGAAPRSGLVADAAGNLFGTTHDGGGANAGTVYELARGATAVATLATFTVANGANPFGTLAFDLSGNLYGTTFTGGSGGGGTVFELQKGTGVLTTLASFTDSTGGNPYAGLSIDAAGDLFGTTTSGNGTLFELPAVGPFLPLDIATTSPETMLLLATVNQAVGILPTADVYTDNGGAIPAAPSYGSALLLPSTLVGSVAIPAGYEYLEVGPGSTVALTGGDRNTRIIGDSFTYVGSAGTVGSGAGVAQITDDAIGAKILVGSAGSATVVASGNVASVSIGDNGTAAVTICGSAASITSGSHSNYTLTADGVSGAVSIGNGAVGELTVTARNDTIRVGGSAMTVAGTSPASGITCLIQANRGAFNNYGITDPNSRTVLSLGYLDRVDAVAGVSTIFGQAGDEVFVNGLAQVLFVGGTGPSTVIGGAANVTTFATSSQKFDAGTAQANVFVGGTGTSTINAGAGGGSFFGGTVGDRYNFGTGNAQVFVGSGGADTLSGAAGTVAPVVFASGAERMTISDVSTPVTVVSFAAGGVIDASQTAGNNSFFAGYGSQGNQTLVGAMTGAGDTFVASANPAATATSLTIADWRGGDVFYLSGFTAADTTTMDTAIALIQASHGPRGDLSFTLADNTTITFSVTHPTNFDAATNSAF